MAPRSGGRGAWVLLAKFACPAIVCLGLGWSAWLQGMDGIPIRPPRLGAPLAVIAELEEPRGVVIDRKGRVYIACAGAHRVRVFDRHGRELATLGVHGGADGEFREPHGVAISPASVLFVVDGGNHRVQRFDPVPGHDFTWRHACTWGGAGRGPGEFHFPTGIAVGHGLVLVADTGNRRLQAFDEDGRYRWSTGDELSTRRADRAPTLVAPTGVAPEPGASFLVADPLQHRLLRVGVSGSVSQAWGGRGEVPGFFDGPIALASAAGHWPQEAPGSDPPATRQGQADGNRVAPWVLVAERGNHRIQLLRGPNESVQVWGGHLLRPREAHGLLHYPDGVACEPAQGLVAVVESFENRCQLFGPEQPSARAENPILFPRDQEFHFGPRCAVFGDVLALTEPERGRAVLYRAPLSPSDGGAREAAAPACFATAGGDAPGLAEFVQPSAMALCGPAGPLWLADEAALRLVRLGPSHATEAPLTPRIPPPGSPGSVGSSGPGVPADPIPPNAPAAWRVLGAWELASRAPASPAPASPEPAAGGPPKPVDDLGLGSITALRVDRRGRMVVLDAVHGQVVVFDAFGERQAHWRSRAPLAESNPAGSYAVRDPIWWRATDLTLWPCAAAGHLSPGTEPEARICLVDALGCRVLVFDFQGTLLASFGERGSGPGRFGAPFGILAAIDGTLWITDTARHDVQRFTVTGEFLGGFGGPGVQAGQFYRPSGIDQLPDGRICIVDHGNHRVQFFSASGAPAGMFGAPWFLAPASRHARD